MSDWTVEDQAAAAVELAVIRGAAFGEERTPCQAREPCRKCGSFDGVRILRNGQDTVRCARCGAHIYNAPRSETGRPARSTRSRPTIPPSQRSRILRRDGYRCRLCGRGPAVGVVLHVAHMISVQDAKDAGMVGPWLNGDINLITGCDECNGGDSRRSLDPQAIFVLLCAERVAFARARADGDAVPVVEGT
jgi:hypothetical protein